MDPLSGGSYITRICGTSRADPVEVHTQGYAIRDEELEIGLRLIAMPVCNPAGKMIVALSLPVPTSRMTRVLIVEKLLPEFEMAWRKFQHCCKSTTCHGADGNNTKSTSSRCAAVRCRYRAGGRTAK